MSAAPSVGSDIIVYNQRELPVLAIEVKTKVDATVEWAIRLRRNFMAHGILPATDYFFIATPSRFFIWRNSGADLERISPILVINAQPLLASYFEQINVPPEEISGSSFELIIRSWLAELIYAKLPNNQIDESIIWIVDIGLQDALEGGYLGEEVLA